MFILLAMKAFKETVAAVYYDLDIFFAAKHTCGDKFYKPAAKAFSTNRRT